MISYFSSRIDSEERPYPSVYPKLTKEDICKDICEEIKDVPSGVVFVPNVATDEFYKKIYPYELIKMINNLQVENSNLIKNLAVDDEAHKLFAENSIRINELEKEIERKKDYTFIRDEISKLLADYLYKKEKYRDFYFTHNHPVMYSKTVSYETIFCPVASIISTDMYRDIEEVILLFMQEIKNEVIDRKKRNDKRKVDEVVRVIFFRDVKTLEIHTVKHFGYKPYMYDIIPYLKRSLCLGHTNEYPYNSIIFKSFCRKSIMQISAC